MKELNFYKFGICQQIYCELNEPEKISIIYKMLQILQPSKVAIQNSQFELSKKLEIYWESQFGIY